MAIIKVSVERIKGTCNLPLLVGDHFFIDGSRLIIPEGGHVCIWALQSMMPVFPILSVKNQLDAGHWVSKVETFSCPDPQGLVQFRLKVVDEEAFAASLLPHSRVGRSRPAKPRSGSRPRKRAPSSSRQASRSRLGGRKSQ